MAAYVLVPAVLLVLNKRVIKVPPQGTVVLDAIRCVPSRVCRPPAIRADALVLCPPHSVLKTALFKRSWDAATPSHMQTTTGSVPEKVTYDDDFVLEVKRTIKACVFLVSFAVPFRPLLITTRPSSLQLQALPVHPHLQPRGRRPEHG